MSDQQSEWREWTDEAIVNTVEENAYFDDEYDEGLWVLPTGDAVEIVKSVRDAYEQRLAAVSDERDALRQQVAELEATREWIPVDKRLPEETTWVLVYADGAVNCMGYTPREGFADWVLQQAPNVFIKEITHWQHLPASPIMLPSEANNE